MQTKSGWTLLATLVFAAPLAAQGISNLAISGSTVSADIELAGGVGAELVLTFEGVSGLSASSLGLSAELVSPASLLGRLPTGVSLLSAFPVVVRIEPPANGGLSFSGVATIELHTENLDYVPGTTLRLFKAPVDASFADVTGQMGSGSYRVRGSTGGFSEFAIVADTRSGAAVATVKYDALEALLDDVSAELPAELAGNLADRLAASRAAYAQARLADAVAALDAFVDLVEEASPVDVPNVWRATRDLDNVAGELRAAAATLRFSLGL